MKKGISLIVLVITIIVIIILAGAVILSLSANNPIESANKATCLSDIANYKSAVALDYAYQVSLTNTGTVTYVKGPSVVALDATISTKYGLTATVGNDGSIVFAGGTSLPTGVTLASINL